jgi:hypothetical protein
VTADGVFVPSAMEAVKRRVQGHGPVTLGLWAGRQNAVNWYASGHRPEDANHEVVVVGWDDTYPGAEFSPDAPADGAWIVQNSWGVSSGDGGYHHVSYRDPSIAGFDYYELGSASDYSVNQSYAVNAAVSFPASKGILYAANVYTAEQSQSLGAVMVSNATPGNSVQVSVYRQVTGTPTSGKLAATSAVVSKVAFGLHTVKLSQPVGLLKGEKYALVVKYTTADSSSSTVISEIEREYTTPYSNTLAASVPENDIIKSGQTYLSTDGKSWEDQAGRERGPGKGYTVGNAMISALANKVSAPTLSLDGKQVGSGYLGAAPNLRQGNVVVKYSDGSTRSVPLSSPMVAVSGYNAKKLGVQRVWVKLLGYPALSYQVRNVAPPVTAVRGPVSVLYVKKNSSYQLNVAAYQGISKLNYPLTYKSSKPSVLAVGSTGKLTAKSVKKKTKVTITVTAYKKSKKITVYVVPKAKSLKRAKGTLPAKLRVGQVYWAQASLGSATNVKVGFTSSKKSVVAVDKYGRIRALKPGTAKVTITEGKKKHTKKVVVKK